MACQFLPPSVLGHTLIGLFGCISRISGSRHCGRGCPVSRRPGLGVNLVIHRLLHHFLAAEVLPCPSIQLPKDAPLAGAERQFLIADVDQHALEDFVEIERFARRMLEIPDQLAVFRVQGNGRVRLKRLVQERQLTAQEIPWLRLRDAPLREVEFGIIAARQPRFRAGAIVHWQIAPGLSFARIV